MKLPQSETETTGGAARLGGTSELSRECVRSELPIEHARGVVQLDAQAWSSEGGLELER